MATKKLSHSDIVQMGLEAGLGYGDATELAYELSPEYNLVAESRVIRALKKLVG